MKHARSVDPERRMLKTKHLVLFVRLENTTLPPVDLAHFVPQVRINFAGESIGEGEGRGKVGGSGGRGSSGEVAVVEVAVAAAAAEFIDHISGVCTKHTLLRENPPVVT